ncbi:response regulator transcription factor [Agrobacterium tumefaciens]|uniref:response regulator transcription factor n=1 Tax=Agrobacterium tumefaciens TaxID=358 RepID=UPI003B9EF143
MGVPDMDNAIEPLVTLVDDDANVRDAMGNLLNSVGIETVAFGSAAELFGVTIPDRPGCLVLDVRMPGMSGLDLHRKLTSRGIYSPVVFLTGHGDISMSVEAMKAGAFDFLTKPVRDQTFLDAVSKAISSDVARRAEAETARRFVECYESLTQRERQMLRMVIAGALNKQIAFDLGISEVTVKLHRSNMMKKMQSNSVSQLFKAWQALPEKLRLNNG